MYLDGKEVPRSCDEALKLLETAAEKPNVRARSRLAALYAIGTCVERDRLQAYRWLTMALAADPNNSWAQQNRELTWRQMTANERTMAEADR
jgi:TPR repeat protein